MNREHSRRFKFLIYGWLHGEIRNEVLSSENVIYKGVYNVKNLNSLLKDVHVGIVPSIWEECYGFVGIEFLAKGIPVIGNNRGGIPDYVIDGQTGWLNQSVSAQELAKIMIDIIERPGQITELNRHLISNRPRYIKTMASHFFEMEKIYQSLRHG